jgi:hypothetical protein
VKKPFRATNNVKYYTVFKGPGTNYSGAFYLEKEKMEIDYEKLNNCVVKQAYELTDLVLTNEMKVRLFQNKIDRAEQMIRARAAIYYKTDR